MRSYFKYLVIVVVLFAFSSANAGSYDDFFIAIKRDNPYTIQSLLSRGFDPDTVDPEGLSGLYLALRDESLKVAAVLADWPRTNVEIRTPEGESPLMIAALKGRLNFVKKLIARGADVNKPGWTPLHYAATGGHLEIMALLLDQNAYIDAASPHGTTPLMMAAQYASADAVKLLLDAGADPSLKNQLGLTAIDFAHRADRDDSAEMIAAAVKPGQQKDKGKW
jgi:ankyrin repeat protein